MKNEDRVAKALLLDKPFNVGVRWGPSGSMVLAEPCPLCGTKHINGFAYNEKGIASMICPETGVELYAVYG